MTEEIICIWPSNEGHCLVEHAQKWTCWIVGAGYFADWMSLVLPNPQCQSTEGIIDLLPLIIVINIMNGW